MESDRADDHRTPAARSRWWALAYGLTALSVVLFANRKGIGLSPDSVFFMSATQCLAEGRGFRTDITTASVPTPSQGVVTFPPGYPALCSVFVLAGAGLEAATLLATATSLSVLVALVFLFTQGVCRTAWMPHVAAVWSAAFGPHLYLVTTGWSEMTYMALSLASLWLIAGWCEDRHTGLRTLAGAGALTAASCVTRFLGVSMFVTGLVAVHLRAGGRGRDGVRRYGWVKPALVYGLVTCIPVWTLVARNRVMRGSFTGERPGPGLTVRENLILTISTAANDLCPLHLPSYRSWSTPALILLWCLPIVLASSRRGFWRGLGQRIHDSPRLRLSIVYPLTYAYVLICLSTLYDFDAIGTRLLGPAYLFLGFVAVAGVEQWLATPSTRGERLLRVAGIVLLVMAAAGYVAKGSRDLKPKGNYFAHFASGPSTQWLKERVKPGDPVFCNQPEVPWLYGRIPTKGPPRSSAEVALVCEQIRAMPKSASAYFVVYRDEPGPFPVPMEELVEAMGAVCAAELADARVMVWQRSAVPRAETDG